MNNEPLSLRERLALKNKGTDKEMKMNAYLNDEIGVGNGFSKRDLAIINGEATGVKRRKDPQDADAYEVLDQMQEASKRPRNPVQTQSRRVAPTRSR